MITPFTRSKRGSQNNPIAKPPLGSRLNSKSDLSFGLVGFWMLNEGGGLVVKDAMLANNGTVSAAVWSGGLCGPGLKFNGSTSFVDVGSAAALCPDAITISAWVNFTSFTNTYSAVVARFNAGATAYYLMTAKSNAKVALFTVTPGGGVSYDGTGAYTLTAGKWHHLVMAYDAAAGLVGYVNGRVDDTRAGTSTAISFSNGSTLFGKDGFTAGRILDGAIDNVRIYNRALARPEVARLYAYPFSGVVGPRRRYWWLKPSAAAAGFFGRPYYDMIAGRAVSV